MRLDVHGDSSYFYDFRFVFSLSLSLFSFVLKQMFVFRDLSTGHPEKDCVCACGVSVVDVFLLCALSSV